MSENNNEKNKRIAKNTLLLYVRTMFVMVISLFTSRVVLNTLGVEDYGVYNVVGGAVAMFSVISGSLSASISRFITFELGKGNIEKLKSVFCTSVNIQIAISLLIIILGEVLGLWFLNYHMNIPVGRLGAANWVLQCSLLIFAINLISTPYNACIIAHEKMSAFAYISILEVSMKLIIVYMLFVSPIDKLVTYAILLVLVALIVRMTYGIYCSRKFQECKYQLVYDHKLVKEMTGFAGWSFFTNGAYIFNTQGINILINLYFGVAVNAARGISIQVESAIMRFVNDFTTAVNPQITKSCAVGDKESMFKLVCRGAKFSYFLMFCLALPFLFETPLILKLWLNIVPDHTVAFFRLSMIGSMCNMLGNTGATACMATGKIRHYVIVITTIGCLVFPFTWIAFKLGAVVETTYLIFIVVYISLIFIRLHIMKGLIGFPPIMFIKEVLLRVLIVTIPTILIPYMLTTLMNPGIIRLLVVTVVSFCSGVLFVYALGLSKGERVFVRNKIIELRNKVQLTK